MSEVTIFAKPGCPHCAAAKDDFQRRGIRYHEYDVKADPDALRRMLELNGNQRLVPTIVQDERVTIGFNGY
jgi:glutaredoxin